MKRVVINKIFLVIMLALIFFASLSIVIVYYQTYSFYKENLVNVANNYQTKLIENYKGASPDDYNVEDFLIYNNSGVLQINLIMEDGRVIGPTIDHFTDAKNEKLLKEREEGVISKNEKGEAQNFSNEKIFKRAVENGESKVHRVRGLKNVNTIKLAIALKIPIKGDFIPETYYKEAAETYTDQSFCVLYTSIDIEHTNIAYYWIIPTVFGIMLILMLICSYFVKNMVRDIVDPIIDVKNILYDINRGNYKEVEIYSKYRDIQLIINEIAVSGLRLNTTLKQLDYEQNKTHFLLDNMSQGVIALSSDNDVLLANKAVLQIFKNSKNMLGGHLNTLIEDEALLKKIDLTELGSNEHFEYEINSRQYRIDINIIEDDWYMENNKYIKILIFNDITEEYQSMTMRREFFANSSHELKTPLTAITGFSELLMLVDDKATKEKCATEINQNAKKMMLLITDMLNLSKIEANITEEEFKVINLRDIAEEAAKKIQPILTNKNIKLSIKGKAEIYGRETKIEEVFTNLIDNAIKYNNENGWVKVNVKETARCVVVEIADNGIGIASEHLGRLFERFYVVDKSRNKKVNSTGLGLSIVKHIIQNHHGKIICESELNVGTKFIITFPKLVYDSESGEPGYDRTLKL